MIGLSFLARIASFAFYVILFLALAYVTILLVTWGVRIFFTNTSITLGEHKDWIMEGIRKRIPRRKKRKNKTK